MKNSTRMNLSVFCVWKSIPSGEENLITIRQPGQSVLSSLGFIHYNTYTQPRQQQKTEPNRQSLTGMRAGWGCTVSMRWQIKIHNQILWKWNEKEKLNYIFNKFMLSRSKGNFIKDFIFSSSLWLADWLAGWIIKSWIIAERLTWLLYYGRLTIHSMSL